MMPMPKTMLSSSPAVLESLSHERNWLTYRRFMKASAALDQPYSACLSREH